MEKPQVILTTPDGKERELEPNGANVVATLRYGDNQYVLKVTNKGKLVMT